MNLKGWMRKRGKGEMGEKEKFFKYEKFVQENAIFWVKKFLNVV
jgi:hypothetical protein